MQVHIFIAPKSQARIIVVFVWLQQIEVMEKEGMPTIPILPFLHQLKHRRRLYPAYAYFIFAIELFFVVMLPLTSSQPVADTPLATVIDVYQNIILLSPISLYVVTSLFFLVPILLLLVVLTLYLQSHMRNSDRYARHFGQLRRIYIICLIALQATILPGFLMAAHNIIKLIAPEVRLVSFINLPFAVVLIALDKERRLYQGYFILIVMVRLFLPLSWTPLVITLTSCWVATDERAVHKRIGYYLMGVWCGLITLSNSLGAQLNSFQLLVALAATATLTLLCPNAAVNCDCLEQNESLMALTERMMDGRELNLKEKMAVSKAVFRFREELLAAEKHLSERQAKWLSVEYGLQGEQMCQFLATKIAFELRREYSHELKMQQLQCEVRLGKVGMRALFELEALIQQVITESTFRQKEKLHELVTLTDQRFLRKEQNADASTLIAHEKQIERLYELFINIAILMQQFWTLHKASRLSSHTLSAVLRQVAAMEEEAQAILRKAGRFGSTRHELLIFEYLRKLVNNSHRTGEWLEAEEGKEGVCAQHRNYILIEQGSILGMSNRLLNEFQLTRKEAEGYRLSDIVNQQTAEFLTARLDRLIEEDPSEQTSFILPLKVSRERPYIQPYRAEVEILPELMKGIKFMLHLEKPTQLQKTPFLLYCGNSDSVVGITRNFASYFGLQHDHYLFHDFTHELFNVDILALVQSPAKESSQIICEFKAKRTSTRGDGRSQVTHVPVVLRKVRQYEVREETLVLLAIVKRQQLERTQMTNLMSEKIVFMEDTRKDDSGRGEEELHGQTFCKIANPYENLIDEKISKMEQFYRMSYPKWLLLVVGGFILLLLATLAALPMQLSGVTSSLMENYNNNMVLNDKAINTLELFTHSAILYQLGHYPQQFLAVDPAYDLASLTAEYTQKVNSDIQTILEQDIVNQIFAYSEQLRGVSIYDILGSAKLAITTRNIASLIAAWPSISNATGTALVASEHTLGTMADFFQVFSWFAILIGALVVVAAEVVSFKVEEVFQKVLHLYETIDHQHSQQFVLKYRVFAHQLYSSSYFRGVKANSYLQKFKNKKQLDSIEEISTLLYLQKEVGFQLQQENVPADSVPGEVKVSRKFCLSFLWQESYLLLLLLFFVGFLQLFLYFLLDFQSGFSLVLDHSIHLHEARGNISYNSAYFMTSSLQEALPLQQQMQPKFPTKMFLTSQLSTPLPPYFSAYTSNESHVVNSDLCARQLNTNPLYAGMSCGKVVGGIMELGFPEAVIFFNDLVNKYSFTGMSQLGTLFRSSATYPVFLEILYLRRALYNLITSLEIGFKQRTQEYTSAQSDTLNTIIRLGWLLMPLFLVILAVFYLCIREKCGTALKAFFILPKEYLLEMRVTKILRQRDILNYIEMLAF